jgi:hypothetical protein
MARGALLLPLLLLFSVGALGRPLAGSATLLSTNERRQLAEDLNLVLGLDASSGDLSGDATWASTDPSVSVKLTNSGYDAAYEGSVVFTPPAASGDLGTYGQSSELLAVRDGAWGSELTGGCLPGQARPGQARPGDSGMGSVFGGRHCSVARAEHALLSQHVLAHPT